MAKIVLDHINDISYDPESSPIPNPHAFWYLPNGLVTLANHVRSQEIKIIEMYKGKPPIFSQRTKDIDPILHSMFNWFATALVSFINLIGLIDGLQKNNLKYGDISPQNSNSDYEHNRHKVNAHRIQYIQKIHPEIQLWRNKVSAHFALTQPRVDDNLATLAQSVMKHVMYKRPYLEAGGFQWVIGEDESQLPKWNLTQVFEDLCPRFWPERKISELPAYQ